MDSSVETENTQHSGGQSGALPGGPAEALGQVVGLMMASPSHKHLFVTDLEWLVAPPILLRQFRIFRRDSAPVGFVSWAFLSTEAGERLAAGRIKLSPAEWNTGGQPWLIDVVAPFGGGEAMIKEIKEKVFADRKLKVLQPAPDGSGLAVVEW